MLEFCVKQNVFLYAMIAAGIAGVWCLFWNNRFYIRAIRDLGRLKDPKAKWTKSVLTVCQKKAHPFSNTGAFLRSQMAQGRVAGISLPALLRGSQNMALVILALSVVSLWAVYRYQYGEETLFRYLGTGIVAAGGLVFLRLCLDFGGKEEILLNGWTDYLENEFRSGQDTAKQAVREGVPSAMPGIIPDTVQSAKQQDKVRQQGSVLTKNAEQKEAGREAGELFSDSEKEERISRVREGIRQTAAADSRFAGMLTPEEEKLMREIIREYV